MDTNMDDQELISALADGQLRGEALARGVRIRSAERYHRTPPDHVTLVLSYAGVPEASLKRAGARLAEACLAVAGR